MRIEAWRVHDTGLVAAPGPFRRLPGVVRHHSGRGAPWPDRITLEVAEGELVVEGVGAWALADVTVRVVAEGPPVSFVVEVPDGAHLLAAAAAPDTRAVLDALGA